VASELDSVFRLALGLGWVFLSVLNPGAVLLLALASLSGRVLLLASD
jgi:hypothetical protein